MLLVQRMASDDTVVKNFASLSHPFDDRSPDDHPDDIHAQSSLMSQPRGVRSPIRFDDFHTDLGFSHHHHPMHVHQPNYALGPSTHFPSPSQYHYPGAFRSSYDFGFDPAKVAPALSPPYMPSEHHLQPFLSPLTIPDSRPSPEPASANANGASQSPDVSSPTSTENNASGTGMSSGQPTHVSSDQPPTTQGKARTRVYVACLQCRSRKIRCDGAKPTCHNCSRRSSECKYDAVPKRRGPDKKPGARQRTVKKKDVDDPSSDSKAGLKKKRRKSDGSLDRDSDGQKSATRSPKDFGPPSASPSSATRSPHVDLSLNSSRPLYITPPIPPLAESDQRQSLAVPIPQSLLHGMTATMFASSFPPYERQTPSFERRGFLQSADGDEMASKRPERRSSISYSTTIGPEPSLEFSRKTWWDNLLNVYSHNREASFEHITTDLKFLFKASNYWVSYFNVPLFFKAFLNAETRDRMQPSLVLAGLALATFMRSSEIDQGTLGRSRALWLRDTAQSALEASFNAQSIDPPLAQAAWLLALFEVSAHPNHSSERATSAMIMLDSIIRAMALTTIDAENSSASVFSPRAVPAVARQGGIPAPSPRQKSCSCQALSLGHNWPLVTSFTPLWMHTPAWDQSWSDAEIRKEESRRLCWSALSLATAHTAHAAAFSQPPLDFYLIQPSNYALLFPGETLSASPQFDCLHDPKETVWALYARAMLLWNSCLRMRGDAVGDAEKARFAVDAWLESSAIEEALDAHVCGAERAFLFQGREFLFNTRMCISYEFRRYIPNGDSDATMFFHRKKAEEWLSHQAAIAKRVMLGLHTVTGQQDNMLARRPYFVWWFMSQVARSLLLWQCDSTLVLALDVAQSFLPPIDYLSSLWPCTSQRAKYRVLHERLTHARLAAGLPPPPPISIENPVPSVPQRIL